MRTLPLTLVVRAFCGGDRQEARGMICQVAHCDSICDGLSEAHRLLGWRSWQEPVGRRAAGTRVGPDLWGLPPRAVWRNPWDVVVPRVEKATLAAWWRTETGEKHAALAVGVMLVRLLV